MSKAEILDAHRQRIDSGKSSTIFGLASFAEGVDLPGDYCGHVIIAKLPFSAPDDPIDAAHAELLESAGRNPFMVLTVPSAALRLLQACGRLLRTETDSGSHYFAGPAYCDKALRSSHSRYLTAIPV